MDIKALSQGMGHLDSLMTPIVLPPRTAFPGTDGAKIHGISVHDIHRTGPLSTSSATESASTTGFLAVHNTSNETTQRLEPPPPSIEASGRKLSRSTSLRTDTSHSTTPRNDAEGSLSPTSSPIVVRGFVSSTTLASEPNPSADEHTSTVAKEKSTEQQYKSDAPLPKPMDQHDIVRISRKLEVGTHRFGSPAHEAEIVESLNSEEYLHSNQQLQPQSRSSRLWTRVRRAVQGNYNGPPRNTVYLTSGSVATPTRAMSDTHLPSVRHSLGAPATPTNITMPSFSSSAISLLSEDHMSPQKGSAIITSGLRTSMVFETPPESAANSPRPSSPVSPTIPGSPTSSSRRSPSFQQHNLPGLARRSSIKSPIAAAELTTAESRVSQFLYTDQQLRPAGAKDRRTSMSQDFELQQDFFSTPNALERSQFKSALQKSPLPEVNVEGSSLVTAAVTTSAKPIGRSRSTSDAPRRRPQPSDDHGKELHDAATLREPHKRGQEFEMIEHDKGSSTRTRPSLDGQQEHAQPTPIPAKNENSGHSMSPYLSPDTSSRLLSPPTQHLPTTKEERRKSAISFGGYFTAPSEAARRSRNMTMMMDSGPAPEAAADAKASDVVHVRRTSFFERASPPSLSVLTSLLPSLPSLSQSMAGPSSPLLSRSASNATVTALEQYQQHSRRASGISIIATEPAAPTSTTSTAGVSEPRDPRKKLAPLKITPLLISGVSSIPSPMFAPMSATIPRGPFSAYPSVNGASAPTLDRYFFTVDQVHEWNIPSYGRVRLTDHAPMVFQTIRDQFNYTLADLDEALSQPMTVMKTPGKSDAIFFASHNHGRFLLKTLRGAEPENLKGFLSDYLAHVQKHPNTLLPRYLGMYTFERLPGAKLLAGQDGHGGAGGIGGMGMGMGGLGDNHGNLSKNDIKAAQRLHMNGTLLSGKDDTLPQKMVVVVLANVFDTPEIVQERYDFKGSNVGRRTLPVDRTAREKTVAQDKPLQPEFGRSSMEMEHGPTDLFGRRIRKNDTPGAWRDSRASTIQFEPTSRQEAANRPFGGADDVPVTDDISHLTLKETDFQNRIFTGETQMIHLGTSRRLELLTQLEEDTALLRKHGFMDYSMLVGIRIVPKARPQEAAPMSPESSRRGSMSSRGSDADDSNLDSSSSEDEGDMQEADGFKALMQKEGDIAQKLERLWKVILKDLGEKAQDAIREVTSFKEGVMTISGIHKRTSSRSSGHNGSSSGRIESLAGGDSDGRLPAVELKPVHSPQPSTSGMDPKKRRKSRDSGKGKEESKSKGKGKLPMTLEEIDRDSFQTVRYAPRTSDTGGHGSRRPGLAEAVGASLNDKSRHREQQTNTSAATQSSTFHYHPFAQQGNDQSFDQQQQTIWSKGVPSEGLSDEYEVVYHFGMIDILQKYNLVKWIEKNLKGANVRLLGGGATGVTQNSVPLVHPGRSTPSTSHPASSIYQLPTQASASEPSLPSVFHSTPPTQSHSTLSVLMEDSRSSIVGSDQDTGLPERLSTSLSSIGLSRTPSHPRAAHLDPSSSSTFSSARLSQDESTLNPPSSEEASSGSLHSSSTSSSSTSNPYPAGVGRSYQQQQQSRLSSSAPFSKSIARLSQVSHYSHSSQQSQHSHQSGRSRDSRLSFEIRESESMPSSLPTQQQAAAAAASGSPLTGNGFLSASPPSIGVLPPQQQQETTQQQQPRVNPVYQMPQHAEVSVEEPGRYAERLIEFMRSVTV
ncbi:hypothetical protein B0O80DRAFT_461390 [Mortierella sp. GBAus27b]|nr:hypothetical protein B0O80DRAFT_461390 [Mortierella sp. GBAus27b]